MNQSISCFDAPAQMSVEQGKQALLDEMQPITEHQFCSIEQLVGKVLAEDIISPVNVPAQTNSAMDGFAIHLPNRKPSLGNEISLPYPSEYKLVGQALAGHGFDAELAEGEAVMITTGAPLPSGANTVVMKEFVNVAEGFIKLQRPDAVALNDNIRQAGEDLAQGSLALSKGTRIFAQHQGLLASLGFSEVKVIRPLKVALFSTGDEVVAQGQPLPKNSIYDTNRFTLQGLLNGLQCDITDLGIIQDDETSLVNTLSKAAEDHDVVISSGGVSVGDADYIKSALAQVGEIGFWRLNIRPGRPFAFGRLGKDEQKALFFGLPGNPVAVMVTFLQLAQPALRKLAGESRWQLTPIPALAQETMRSRQGRTDFHRGIFSVDASGQLVVRTTGSQGSGILRSMVEANCLIEIPDEQQGIRAGEKVMIQPFSDLI